LKAEKHNNINSSKWFIGLFLLILNITPSIANEFALRAFDANYSLHIAGLHVGYSTLSLSQSGNLWRWQTSSEPRGVYSLLTNKKPYSETRFLFDNGRYLIQNLLISDEGDKNLYETAHFNWQKSQAKILRKRVTSTASLSGDVYDYHSINWLVANMMKTEKNKLKVNFYVKGAIVKSIVKRIDDKNIEVAGQKVSAWVYEQTTANSSSKLQYYFNPAKPLLPLKIEKIKPGKKTAILLLKSATWH
jgi:hypothetical protein|tara:strand:+ start:705 stop:1442 length:738 start_codon:yes stop_codon:yes gene_type:complete